MFEIERKKRFFTRDLFLSFCGKNLEHVLMEFGQQKSQFRIYMQTPVENPLATIESFNRQFQIGERRMGRRSSGDGSRKWEIPCSMS